MTKEEPIVCEVCRVELESVPSILVEVFDREGMTISALEYPLYPHKAGGMEFCSWEHLAEYAANLTREAL